MSPAMILALLRDFVLKFDGLKKISAMIAGVIVAFALRYGIDLDAGSVAAVISPILAYLIGQGTADGGKPKVLISEPKSLTDLQNTNELLRQISL